jgi:transcriptional regulator with XRE-family HTH domain
MTSDHIRALHRELGRALAGWRRAGDFTQAELGRKVGYSRSTISTVESGRQQVPREFWESCDQLLGADLAAHYDRVQAATAAERRPARGLCMPADSARVNVNDALDEAAVYERFGWPIVSADGRLKLVTGSVVDALEVSRPAGMLAAHWWLGTGGAADPIRGLPALPPPESALAVISADARLFILAASGACPWAAEDNLPALPTTSGSTALIRWHAEGSRIPAPPGPGVAWLHAPAGSLQLPSPVTLLDLLAKATSAVRRHPGALALQDGILAVPAWRN